jgi:hypothetical protein
MKIVNHPAVIALGAATLCLLPFIGPLVSPSHLDVYHLSSSALTIYLSVAVNVCLLWILFTALLLLARRPGRAQRTIWLGIILFLPWALLKIYVSLTQMSLTRRFGHSLLGLSLLAFVALLYFWRPSLEPYFQSARAFVATLLAFASLSGVILCIQLICFAWQARSLNVPLPLHQRLHTSVDQLHGPRVIWIVLDELSYQQVYEKRFPGLQLPAFDQLASQSTVFTHVVPAGIYTHIVIPSLLSGRPIDQIRSSADGQLFTHDPASNAWQRFDPHDTVFQDALNNGYTTAIAGWFNPYCRIMPEVLDHCFWINHLPLPSGFVADQTFLSNFLEPLRRFASLAHFFVLQKTHIPMNAERDAALHVNDYHDLFTAADTLLTDPSINFMLLHMPVPHPEGIYNRRTSSFVTGGGASYIDNLALADHYLAHVHQILQQQDQWDTSTIIVMGDHSWRTRLLWAPSPIWTPEDQAASHGNRFDDRPAYIVKLPQQQEPAQIDNRFAAVNTRALLDAIISNRITTPADLREWVEQRSPPGLH